MSDPRFRYDFSRLELRELGYMLRLARESWPVDAPPTDDQVSYYDQLFDEILRRWACADDIAHRQGQRL